MLETCWELPEAHWSYGQYVIAYSHTRLIFLLKHKWRLNITMPWTYDIRWIVK